MMSVNILLDILVSRQISRFD